jgi:hypothetical protein
VKQLCLASTLLALCSLSYAANPDAATVTAQEESALLLAQRNAAQAAPHSPSATSTCAFNFTSGQGDTLLTFCVTVNGNIAQLETPQSVEYIALAPVGEGYGICDLDSNAAYFDYADFGDSGNWGPPALLKQSTSSVQIARTTSDGIWTLTQIITQLPGTVPSVKVAMTLKNNSKVGRSALLIRYADVDAYGQVRNNLDTTEDSAFAWNSVGSTFGYGMQIQNVGKAIVVNPLTQFQPGGPDPCNPVFNLHLLTNTDGSIGMVYLVEVPMGKSTTVSASYRGL